MLSGLGRTTAAAISATRRAVRGHMLHCGSACRKFSTFEVIDKPSSDGAAPLRVSLLGEPALTSLLSNVGNRGRTLQDKDLYNIVNRIVQLDYFGTPRAVAAACHAIGGTDLREASAGAITCYVDTLCSMLAQTLRRAKNGESAPSLLQLTKYLLVLKAFSDQQDSAVWERYFDQLSGIVSLIAADDAYFRRSRLSPHGSAKMLSSLQYVASILAGNANEDVVIREGMVIATRQLLGAVSALLSLRMSGRFSGGDDLALAFEGVRGMCSSYKEVRSALRFLKNAVSRISPGRDLSGSHIAACMGAFFNMSTTHFSIETDEDDDLVGAVLYDLSNRMALSDRLFMRHVGLAMTAALALGPGDRKLSMALLEAMTTALRRHNYMTSIGSLKDDTENRCYFPFHSFSCSMHCLGGISEPPLDVAANKFLNELCAAYAGRSVEPVVPPVLSLKEQATYSIFLEDPLETACSGLFGLRALDGNSEGVRRALATVRRFIRDQCGHLSNDALTRALCGISSMSSDCEEVLALLQTLSELSPNEAYYSGDRSNNGADADCISGEQAALCLSALRRKRSDCRSARSILHTLTLKLDYTNRMNVLQMEDGDIALSFQGLESMTAADCSDIEVIRGVLRCQLEYNYKTTKGLRAGDAVAILSSFQSANSNEAEVLMLLGVVAARLDEAADGLSNEGVALAMGGLHRMSNEQTEVQYLVASLAKKSFMNHESNLEFSNRDVSLFLSGFRSMRYGLRDESTIAGFLSRALNKMQLHRPVVPMTSMDLSASLEGIRQLTDSEYKASATANAVRIDDNYGCEAAPPLQQVLADIRAVLEQRERISITDVDQAACSSNPVQ